MSLPQERHLAGCVVLITADRRSAELGAALERHGALTRHTPAISMVPILSDDTLLESTRRVIASRPDIVIATTGIGFRGWIEAADSYGLAEELLEVLRNARLIARGPKARGAIQAAGLLADWVAESEVSAEIGEYLLSEGVEGKRIAVQHHGAGSDGLDELFEKAGATVDSLVVYRWGPPADPVLVDAWVRAAARGEVDAVVFTSAPGAAAWVNAAREAGVLEFLVARFVAGTALAVAVGAITAKPLRDVGIEPLVPDRGRLGSLIRTLVAHFAARESEGIETVAGRLQFRNTAAVLQGQALELSPSGLAVLRILAAGNGDVIPRSVILGALPGSSQDPHAAEVAIARLREASGCKTLVRTVVKRGYRLDVTL